MIIKALTAILALAFVIAECAVVRKAQQYDAADYKGIKVEADK